jgi:hypothetical protein
MKSKAALYARFETITAKYDFHLLDRSEQVEVMNILQTLWTNWPMSREYNDVDSYCAV